MLGLLWSLLVYAAIPAELWMEESLSGPFPRERYAVPALCDCLGREEQEKELGYFQIQKFSSKGELPALPWGLAVAGAAFNPAQQLLCWFPVSHLLAWGEGEGEEGELFYSQ